MTMPNFLIIGAAKSGTSSLNAYLRQHPQIHISEIKEPGFFALEGETPSYRGPGDMQRERHHVRDLARYQSLFRRADGALASGEASCIYLYSPKAPERIRHYIPRVRLIALLRNPADRAFSGHRWLVRDGRETLGTFEDALDAEDARVAANWSPEWHHTRRGFYHAQLRRYFDLFDREQIRVYLHDDFAADPAAVVRDLLGFLGLDASLLPDTSVRHNVSGTPRSRFLHHVVNTPMAIKDLMKPLVPVTLRRRVRTAVMRRNIVPDRATLRPETRRRLMELYRDDVLQLQTLIGRDLSHWLAQGGRHA
jgi:hypothetical protein